MPVRIYDIAKKLGIESKEVLAKAKELGISGAKVPSSSLDKITAEFLEEQLGGKRVASAETTSAPPPEPIVILSAPPPPVEAAKEAPSDTLDITSAAKHAEALSASAEAKASPAETAEAPLALPSTAPPQPALPRIGEKVGFIQLPQKQIGRASCRERV